MAQTTLQGPTTDRFGLNVGDETPERGWSARRIIATLNTMFTELYASIGSAGVVAASVAVVPDANKDLGTFRNLRVVRLIHGEGAAASINTAGAATITAAQLADGVIVRDPNGAGRTDTLDTAANIVAAVPGATVGDMIDCLIINGADAAETITLQAGAGGGFDANQTASSRVIPQNSSKRITIRLTNVTASSEAYVIYA